MILTYDSFITQLLLSQECFALLNTSQKKPIKNKIIATLVKGATGMMIV